MASKWPFRPQSTGASAHDYTRPIKLIFFRWYPNLFDSLIPCRAFTQGLWSSLSSSNLYTLHKCRNIRAKTCETYQWKLADFCPNFDECERGCICNDGYVKANETFDSPCVNMTECPTPECNPNEEFNRCGPSCHADCDNPEPVCDDNCTPGCRCAEGFIKPPLNANEDPTSVWLRFIYFYGLL